MIELSHYRTTVESLIQERDKYKAALETTETERAKLDEFGKRAFALLETSGMDAIAIYANAKDDEETSLEIGIKTLIADRNNLRRMLETAEYRAMTAENERDDIRRQRDAANRNYDAVLSVLAGETPEVDNEASQAVRSLMLRGVQRMWRPIESAPKDGTTVLLGSSKLKWTFSVSRWIVEPHNCWADHSDPTHWMPLPTAPI